MVGGGGQSGTPHKFFASDERFFLDVIRIAPFPAEAIAQLQTLASLPNLASFDVVDAASWIFDKGEFCHLMQSVPHICLFATLLRLLIQRKPIVQLETTTVQSLGLVACCLAFCRLMLTFHYLLFAA